MSGHIKTRYRRSRTLDTTSPERHGKSVAGAKSKHPASKGGRSRRRSRGQSSFLREAFVVAIVAWLAFQLVYTSIKSDETSRLVRPDSTAFEVATSGPSIQSDNHSRSESVVWNASGIRPTWQSAGNFVDRSTVQQATYQPQTAVPPDGMLTGSAPIGSYRSAQQPVNRRGWQDLRVRFP